MSLEPQRKQPFAGDLRQTIPDACAEVGGGTVEGYLDKIVRDRPGTKLAQQALDLKRRFQPLTSISSPSQPARRRTRPPEAILQQEYAMNKQNQTHAFPKPISVEIGGVTHQGRYQTENRMIRVDYEGASKATQLGGSPPGVLARLILAELVREHHG